MKRSQGAQPASNGSGNPAPPKRNRASNANTAVPFSFWSVYFNGEMYSESHECVSLVRAAIPVFAALVAPIAGSDTFGTHSRTATIAHAQLMQSDELKGAGFQERLRLAPGDIFAALGLAFHEVLAGEFGAVVSRMKRVVRLVGYDQVTPLKELKANLMGTEPHLFTPMIIMWHVGRFISVRGTIVRVSSIKPVVTQIAFTCSTCMRVQVLEQTDGKFHAPSKCVGGDTACRGKTFLPDRSGLSDTKTVDWQRIRIQEKLPDDQKDAGRIPRTVECELTDDLVDLVVPGDVVCVSGIVKVLETQEGKFKKGASMYYLYISGNSLIKASSGSSDGDTQDAADEGNAGFTKDGMSFSRKDLYGIRQIHDVGGDTLFPLLVNSLCPAIFGHEIVKAGLLLALFGGRRRTAQESKEIDIRSNPHVLVVGDPGLGKSQMLSAVVKAAPRGVYVCGNTTTTSGLTVTLCKDGESGESALEAGALVLGDRGVCCIDEFDKLTEHQALLEAMEQQSISIAKAGMVCTLPARTSVIAAANPIGGHYNKAKTVSENLKMNTALLSRFDLVFILLDKPDEQLDKFLSDHIIKLHSGQNVDSKAMKTWASKDLSGSQKLTQESETLVERLKVPSEDFDPIPLSLLRKYIAYSKKYVQPKVTKEAAKVLQEFYLTLRMKYRSNDSTPITTRQLESMIRLVEARARSELRDEVTRQDALDVIEIMRFSLWKAYEDEYGNVEFERSQGGTGMSRKGEPKRFMAKLSRIVSESAKDKFNYDELHEIGRGDISVGLD
ncbi:MCM2/3/5 family-domain-containing protein [Chytriomyces sp. MP71]|nr:MCM2/3/5 family-domain-containing protein [Chytriomyces sp. MP71]